MNQVRALVFYKNYFYDIFNKQSEKVKEKIDYVLFLITHIEKVPMKFLKHLEGHKGFYEIRVEHSSNILVRLNKYIMAKKESRITNFNEHLTERYGARGSEKRTEFEIKAKAFLIGELIKEERKNAKMTQEQLADKIGAKKSFISRIENGKTDIQLSTLYRLLEFGLGKTVEVSVN